MVTNFFLESTGLIANKLDDNTLTTVVKWDDET